MILRADDRTLQARAMRVGGVLLIVVCALPAHGDHVSVSPQVAYTLTRIESLPTKDDLLRVFSDPVPQLRDIALNAAADFGVRLGAIRALPLFCPIATPCGSTPAHLAILDVLASIDRSQREGTSVLALRAAIEALGIARSGNPGDVDTIVPLLAHGSRDVRAAAAHALRDLCDTRAIVPLRARLQVEQVAQVRLAISAALRDLDQCS